MDEMTTFHAEVVFLMNILCWLTLRIEITDPFHWTVLKATAGGRFVTVASAGVDCWYWRKTFYGTHPRDITSNIDERMRAGLSGTWKTKILLFSVWSGWLCETCITHAMLCPNLQNDVLTSSAKLIHFDTRPRIILTCAIAGARAVNASRFSFLGRWRSARERGAYISFTCLAQI